MRHLFVTQDFGPDLGGMARRHVELCRRFSDARDSISVSTVANEKSAAFDAGEPYPIERHLFPFSRANRFSNQVRWAHSLTRNWRGRVDVLHCGNIRPVGYAVLWAHTRLRIPYLLYVNGGDLLRERRKAINPLKRIITRRIFSNASGVVATSQWVADLTSAVMSEAGVRKPPPIAAIGLGTDPVQFSPARKSTAIRTRFGLGEDPFILTVARLVPHKGQDTGLRVMAELRSEFPNLHYLMIGDGHFEGELRNLAASLGVGSRAVFAGAMSDSDLSEAYAAATIYVGLSRVDREINAEGFGISFLEAAASGVPSVAGDSGGIRSAVRDNETGFVVPPTDIRAISDKVRLLLIDKSLRDRMGSAARASVELHNTWDRVARDTREFAREVVSGACL